MVSKLAKGDWEDLQAEGLKPTLEDFDRLNQLALRLTAGAEPSPAVHPRIGWAGGVPFHELTVGAILWLEDYGFKVDDRSDNIDAVYFFACAHATHLDVLYALEKPDDILKAVRKWLRFLPCTASEIARACRYAVNGFNDATPAKTALSIESLQKSGRTEVEENIERLESLMAQTGVLSGMKYLDLLMLTPSRLNARVLAAQIQSGLQVSHDVARFQAQYSATLAEIHNRLVREERDKAISSAARQGEAQ